MEDRMEKQEQQNEFTFHLEDVSQTKKELKVEVPADEISSALEESYKAFQKKVKLPGFRVGKVPIQMVRRRFGREVEEDLLQKLLPVYFDKAVQKADIDPVDMPIIKSVHMKAGEPFHFEATVYVKPDFEVKDYLGTPIPEKNIEVKEEIVDKVLEKMRDGFAELSSYEDENHCVETGDVVEADFEGFLEGAPFEGGKAENFMIEVGAGRMIPGFEEGLRGMKREEAKDLTVTFPADYANSKLAGKEVLFKVNVKDIKEKRLPELDDDFAKDVGEEYSTLEEVKQGIRDKYRAEEEKKDREELHKHIMDEVMSKNPIEVPEVMVVRHKHSLMERMHRSEEESEPELTPEDKEWLEKQARKDVAWSLISEKIAEKEGITLSSEDFETGLEKHAAESSMSKEALRDLYNIEMGSMEPFRMVLLNEKILDFLLQNAKVTKEGSARDDG
jgi:trigger factor